jgi:diguanylate cyclase (GGDEF)-like protein/PAS domain S-box-containing protein
MRTKKKVSGETLQQTASLLAATLESTADGLLVIDNSGTIKIYNKKFLSMWHIPESLAAKRDDKILLENALGQLKDPEGFIEKVNQLYSQPEANSFDVLEFKDGRVFERFSQPQWLGNETVGRVWSFRDVTDRRRAEEAQRRNQETAERLAQEMAVIAEIGRLIGSTLDIGGVYERVAAEVRRLIPFDRLNVNLSNPAEGTVTIAYFSGMDIPDRRPGDSFPLAGSLNEVLMRTRIGLLIQPENIDEVTRHYPYLFFSFRAGMHSLISVPLISRDEVIGALHFRAMKPGSYSEADLRLAERIGAQIAGAIANARLHDQMKKELTERKRMEEELRASEEKYRNILENIEDGYFEVDLTGNMAFFNPSLCRILGYPREEMPGMNNRAFMDAENAKKVFRAFNEVYVTGIPRRGFEWETIRKDGSRVYMEVSVSLIARPGEKPTGFRGIARDVTDRKQAEEALRESEERYRTILENIEDGYFEVDLAGNLTFFNDSVCRMAGYPRAEMMGMNNRQYTDKENSKILYEAFNKVFRTGDSSKGVGYEIIGKDGTKLYIESSVSLIRNSSGQPVGFRGIMRNITDRKRMEETLKNSENRYRELSIVDDLTQLYNSRHFYVQLKIELDRSNRYGQPLTLLLLDLDNFKAFNDTYGHVEGDQVLLRLGQVVKRCLRQTDSAYRYGGEEFTILLPMTTSADGAVTAERIRTEFKKETFSSAPGQDVHVTVSIGLAQYKPQEEMKAFVHRVDQLMYQGKKNGKDRVCSGS